MILPFSSDLTKTPAHGLLRCRITEHFCRGLIDHHGLGGIGLKIPGESPAGYHFYFILVDIIPIDKIRVHIRDLQITFDILYLTIEDQRWCARDV